MQTQMAGVNTAGQNIANVNTPGYSRQRVDITTTPDLATNGGYAGTGSQVAGIQQIVSNLLNGQIQSNGSDLGYQQGRQTALQSTQDALGEFLNSTNGVSSSGLSSQLSSLFSAFQGVATSPNSISARQALIGAAQNLATGFNQVSQQFGTLKTALNTTVSSGVDSANQLLSQVADLNKQISTAEFSGGSANDLRDQREQALENLSKLANISTSTDSLGQINVSIGGQSLVSGRQQLDSLQTYDGGSGQLLVQTATGGASVALTSGSIQGTIEAGDNDLGDMQTKLDALASNLISAVNSVHNGGFSPSGTTGASFFNGTDASNISVNQSLADNPSLIQTSGSVTGTSDNSIALQLSQLASTAQSGLGNQTLGDFYNAAVTTLGTSLNDANTQVTNQSAVADMLTTQRGSVSGVNIDEEMTNLLTFQRSYTASAELLKTVDQMIQTTLGLKT